MSNPNDKELPELHDQMFARSEALKRQILAQITFVPESADLVRWREENKVIAVPYDGKSLYPSFQFDAQQKPLTIVQKILRLFSEDSRRTAWQNLFWFVSLNAWLEGKTPESCLMDREHAVLDAATQEIRKLDDY